MKSIILDSAKFLTMALIILMSSTTFARSDQSNSSSDFNWDLAVSHGNQVTLMSLSSTNESYVLAFPLPKLEINANRSEFLDVVSLDADEDTKINKRQITFTQLEKEWPNTEVLHVISDASKNLLYFTHFSKPLGFRNLCVFNISSNETKLLLQAFKSTISSLVLHDGDLYFIEEKRNTLMKLKTSELVFSQLQNNKLVPIPVMKFNENISISGFTINPINGDIYWSYRKLGTASISYSSSDEEGNEEKVLISTDLNNVHGLAIYKSYLYFINTPRAGLGNKIERVSLTNSSDREIVVDFAKHNQLPFTLAFICDTIYWTETVTKKVYNLSLLTGFGIQSITSIFTSTNKNRNFNIQIPYGLTFRSEINAATCISRNLTQEIVPRISIPDEFNKRCEFVNSCEACLKIQGCKWAAELGSSSGVCFLKELPAGPLNHTTYSEEVQCSPIPSQSKESLVQFCTKQESDTICLNGATCLILEGSKYCLCPVGFFGPKCELNWDQDLENVSFRPIGKLDSSCQLHTSYIIFAITVVGIAVFLALATIVLGIKVCTLSKKPKIRRRYIVSRPKAGISPTPSTSVCEMIDIENCCNMNVCETPCYNSVTGGVSLGIEGDKERLLQF